jgi:hypothetical protein
LLATTHFRGGKCEKGLELALESARRGPDVRRAL